MISKEFSFEYFPVNDIRSVTKSVKVRDLAGYLATEWLPNAPQEFLNSLASVIVPILSPELINGNQFLCANPDIANTDRQWRGVVSWMIGVAFARHIIQDMDYQWWLPVSALKGRNFPEKNPTGKTVTGYWENPPLGPPLRSCFSIGRKTDAGTNLLPDYLACRLNVSGKHEYAFVESKGKKTKLANRVNPPESWINQSKSAQLFFNGSEKVVTRNLIVATKYYPEQETAENRKIVVRAWNENTEIENSDSEIFAHFLANHYSGICWRIGYRRLARIMELVGIHIVNNSEDNEGKEFNTQIANEGLELELARLRRPEENKTLNIFPRPGIMDYPDNSINIPLGQSNFTARFTRSAYEIMGALTSLNTIQINRVVYEKIWGIDSINNLRQLNLSENQRMMVNLNGVVFFERNLLIDV